MLFFSRREKGVFLCSAVITLFLLCAVVHAETPAFMWVKKAGGSDSDIGRGIAVLSDGSVYLTGTFELTATFATGKSLTSAGNSDIFVVKYNPDGSLAWVKRAGGVGYDLVYDLILLPDDTFLITGHFTQSAVFGPGEPGSVTLTTYNSYPN